MPANQNKAFFEAFTALTITTEEAVNATRQIAECVNQLPFENEIVGIASNPTISWYQKRKLIKRLQRVKEKSVKIKTAKF